jgi:hypothetical protein
MVVISSLILSNRVFLKITLDCFSIFFGDIKDCKLDKQCGTSTSFENQT